MVSSGRCTGCIIWVCGAFLEHTGVTQTREIFTLSGIFVARDHWHGKRRKRSCRLGKTGTGTFVKYKLSPSTVQNADMRLKRWPAAWLSPVSRVGHQSIDECLMWLIDLAPSRAPLALLAAAGLGPCESA